MFRNRVPTFLLAGASTAASSQLPQPPVSKAGGNDAPTDVNYHPTEINSAYQLLRLLLRSAEVKIKSRQGRSFMKRRIVTQWRVGREEKDPVKQRALMERAAAVLHAMHIKGRNPKPNEPIELDFSNTRLKSERDELK